jgi:hypothetical protein
MLLLPGCYTFDGIVDGEYSALLILADLCLKYQIAPAASEYRHLFEGRGSRGRTLAEIVFPARRAYLRGICGRRSKTLCEAVLDDAREYYVSFLGCFVMDTPRPFLHLRRLPVLSMGMVRSSLFYIELPFLGSMCSFSVHTNVIPTIFSSFVRIAFL